MFVRENTLLLYLKLFNAEKNYKTVCLLVR